MKVKSVERDEENERYVIQFTHKDLDWFRFLPFRLVDDSEKFKVYLNSLIDDVNLRKE